MNPLIRSAHRSYLLALLPLVLGCSAIGCVTVNYTVNESPRSASAPSVASSTGAPVSSDPRIVYVPVDRDYYYYHTERNGQVVVVPSESRYDRTVVIERGSGAPVATDQPSTGTGGTGTQPGPATSGPSVHTTPPIVYTGTSVNPPISGGPDVVQPSSRPTAPNTEHTTGVLSGGPVADSRPDNRPSLGEGSVAEAPKVVLTPSSSDGSTHRTNEPVVNSGGVAEAPKVVLTPSSASTRVPRNSNPNPPVVNSGAVAESPKVVLTPGTSGESSQRDEKPVADAPVVNGGTVARETHQALDARSSTTIGTASSQVRVVREDRNDHSVDDRSAKEVKASAQNRSVTSSAATSESDRVDAKPNGSTDIRTSDPRTVGSAPATRSTPAGSSASSVRRAPSVGGSVNP